MKSKELFLHTMGEELDALLKQVEMEYQEKINKLLEEQEKNMIVMFKSYKEIQHLTKKNEELMKELDSLRKLIEESEVVATVPSKENTLTTQIYDQIYNGLENNSVKRANVLEDFYNLLKWNIKSKYYEDDKIIFLWNRILGQHRFMFAEWQEQFKDENVHGLLFKRTEVGVRKLIDKYVKLKDLEALKNLFDYLLNQIIRKERFNSYKTPILLYILYYGWTKRYLYQKDVSEFYLSSKNSKINLIYETYLKYLKSANLETFQEALEAINKYEAQIMQIGGSKAAYLNVVFEDFYEVKKDEQKRYLQINTSKELEHSSVTDGQPFEMNDKSALIAFGYQISNRTPEQRWHALKKAVPELGLKKVVYIIDNHIKLRAPNKEKFSYSLSQWSMDLEKLKKTYYLNDFICPKKRY